MSTVDRAFALKPCPFCGGPAELDTRQGYTFVKHGQLSRGTAVAVYCTECSVQASVCREDVPDISPEMVVEMWNRRTLPDDLPVLTQRLVRSLRRAAPDNELPAKAMDYLRRHGLQGKPLRATDTEGGA